MVTAAFWPQGLNAQRCQCAPGSTQAVGNRESVKKWVRGRKGKICSQDHCHQHSWPLAYGESHPETCLQEDKIVQEASRLKRRHSCCGLEIGKAFSVLGWEHPQACHWSHCVGFSWQADSYWSFKEKFTGLWSFISLLKADSITKETKYWLLAASHSLLTHFIIQLCRRNHTTA